MTKVTSMKVEPIAHAINPAGAAQQGLAVIENPTPLGDGRGFSAPRPAATNSDCCPQGKH